MYEYVYVFIDLLKNSFSKMQDYELDIKNNYRNNACELN